MYGDKSDNLPPPTYDSSAASGAPPAPIYSQPVIATAVGGSYSGAATSQQIKYVAQPVQMQSCYGAQPVEMQPAYGAHLVQMQPNYGQSNYGTQPVQMHASNYGMAPSYGQQNMVVQQPNQYGPSYGAQPAQPGVARAAMPTQIHSVPQVRLE